MTPPRLRYAATWASFGAMWAAIGFQSTRYTWPSSLTL